VLPKYRGWAVGLALIQSGIQTLAARHVAMVFVLGHIGDDPRVGLRPASPFGLSPPCLTAPAVPDAWMVREIRPHTLGSVCGTARCADALMHPDLCGRSDGDGDTIDVASVIQMDLAWSAAFPM
jgi:predicted N-acetyltransferase YhbS